MNDQIVSKANIRKKARAAFERGASRDSHNMNPGAPALDDWLDEYDLCTQQWHADQQQDRAWAAAEMAHALGRMAPP